MDGVGAQETVDAILRGRLRIVQPRAGQRLTTDPLLLADFVARTAGIRAPRACDLGSGTGVLALALARLDAASSVEGFEIQPELVAMATRSAELNGLQDRVRFACRDLRTLEPPSDPFDLVVSNPPFFDAAQGHAPARQDRALARHEIGCSMEELLATGAALLRPGGYFAVIYPAERLVELTQSAHTVGLPLTALRLVHPRRDKPASRLLALARRRPGARLVVHPPLILHEEQGWSPEAKALLEGSCYP